MLPPFLKQTYYTLSIKDKQIQELYIHPSYSLSIQNILLSSFNYSSKCLIFLLASCFQSGSYALSSTQQQRPRNPQPIYNTSSPLILYSLSPAVIHHQQQQNPFKSLRDPSESCQPFFLVWPHFSSCSISLLHRSATGLQVLRTLLFARPGQVGLELAIWDEFPLEQLLLFSFYTLFKDSVQASSMKLSGNPSKSN